MMSVATVSPILNSIDNVAGYLKRDRLDSDYSDLGLVETSGKRPKILGDEFVEQSRVSSSVRFGYWHKGLGLNNDEVVRLRNENTNNLLLNHKKLHVVLDLDHTLLNSTSFNKMSPEEAYLKNQTPAAHCLQNVHVLDGPNMQLVTKLRPYIRTFLWEASRMFELSIYTMGSREYALEMARLLDPGNLFFGGRVISRNDSIEENKKSLDVLLARESAVLILDDTKNVWKKENQDNVVEMRRYHFFRSSCQQFGLGNVKSYSELETDECDRYGGAYLANVLKFLNHVHSIFFNEVELKGWDLLDRDVRFVSRLLQQQVLKGCKIVFSHVIPLNVKADTHALWKMAERLGATCSTEVDASVTHVVAANAGTQKSKWAVEQGRFLVKPQWIHTASFMLQRQPEHNFPCQ